MEVGAAIDETGLLLREGGAFYLSRDMGGRYLLSLRRVPVDGVHKQVRVIGHYAGGDLIEVDGIQTVTGATKLSSPRP
ncbi:DUF5818 domain-containing protein [Sphingomonas bacterium]|uniref:DUF5818 domain-containing protein n=1 Tax=Sphingomonas bacterium TaxID=1895847 RepID=UPI001576334B|nr:DUF5818 domain-containing protein [Sphingomonas bacterium]